MFPQKTYFNKMTKLKWITKGMKISSAKKRQLHKEPRHNKKIEFIEYVKRYKSTFKKVVKAAKQMTNNKLFLKHENKSKAVWSVVKHELDIKASRHRISTIKLEDEIIVNPARISECFNEFFINVVKPEVNIADYENNVCPFGLNHNSECLFKFKTVSTIDVEKIILKLKNKNSAGWDGIPAKALKFVCKIIGYPLSKVINQSFEQGSFREVLKYAEVKLLLKKGSREDMGNYRPISLLPVLSKIFENAAAMQIQNLMEKYDIITENQFGFQHGKSTTDAINKFIDKISTSLDNHNKVAGIF
ncbi:uncharacterized protein LOC126426833 [Schistocerca serialis cubense]|uniref:uncharacterized protein LOC126426833 n=1 Tax=Schistocerca serialis cubense TaxID=2023355 RepID=UPI00214E4EC9|nr:uncharacterized protein LOC126426833 [Schistocerca serialis cubense]